jgi:AMP deaminase
MSGFDCVDDESASEADYQSTTHPLPSEVTLDFLKNKPQNPLSFNYYMYYLWANIHVLNQFRISRKLPPFSFRPHAGEAGPLDHLAGAYLVSDGIAHGINLRLSPVLQLVISMIFARVSSYVPVFFMYLYYLTQIGIAVSPLSNNALFLAISENPFPIFFRRGLNVSLSTDDPLIFHR